jgi:hypothetical protein
LKREKYRWKQRSNKDDTLNELDIPEKSDDHCMDALRYIVVSYRKRRNRDRDAFPDDTKLFEKGFY